MRSEPIDWVVLAVAVCLSLAGLSVLSSFGDGGESGFFSRQLVWLSLSLVVFFIAVYTDWRFMRGTRAAFGIYLVALVLLGLVVVVGKVVHGAQSWFDFGSFSFQPVEFAKLALIVVLAKYFTRRHIEIARVRHVVVSGLYALVLIALLFLQPDFGSAVIVGLVWFALVLCAGMSRLHIAGVLAVGSLSFVFLWFFVFTPQQHARIETFVRPLADVRGAGYNALQSVIAVGSGEVWGKGVGYGTQSRLRFLPEYETDFVFAAFAEEWGFIGSVLLFILFGMLVWRVLAAARVGETNFESLFAYGVAALLVAHFSVNVGMNIGLLPVTGVTLPFLSYGGSHLIVEFLSLGMVVGMRRRARASRSLPDADIPGVG